MSTPDPAPPDRPAPLNPFARNPDERSTPEPETPAAPAPEFDADDDFAKLFDELSRTTPTPEPERVDPNAGIGAGTPDAVRARFPIGLPVTASEAITSASDRQPRAGKVERIERDVDRRTQRPRTVVHVRMDESGRVERFIVKDNGFIRPEQLRPVRAADVPDEFTDGQGGRYVDPMARERGRRGGNRTAMIGRVERGEGSAAEGDEYEDYMASAGQARRDARDAAAERGWVTDAGYAALRQAAEGDGTVRPGRVSRINRGTLDQLTESGHMEVVRRVGSRGAEYRLTERGRAKLGDRAPAAPEPEPESPAYRPGTPGQRDIEQLSSDLYAAVPAARPRSEVTEVDDNALDDFARSMTDAEVVDLRAQLDGMSGKDAPPSAVTARLRREQARRTALMLHDTERPESHGIVALRKLDDEELAEVTSYVDSIGADHEGHQRARATARREKARRDDERREAERASNDALVRLRAAEEAAGGPDTPQGYARRLAEIDPLPTKGAPKTVMAAGVQRAALRNAPVWIGITSGGEMDMFDREPPREQLPVHVVAYPDGALQSSQRPGHVHDWSPREIRNFIGETIDEVEARVERDRAEPAPNIVAPGTDTSDATTPAGHVDTSGMRDGARVEVHEAMEAIAAVHRVDGMPRFQTHTDHEMSAQGKYSYGMSALVVGMNRARRDSDGVTAGYTSDSDDAISVRPGGAGTALTFAHEYGHGLDRAGFFLGGEGMGSMRAALPGEPGGATAGERNAAAREKAALQTFLRAVWDSPTYKSLARDGQYADSGGPDSMINKHLTYLRQSDELWARAYAQFIATRSGNALLARQLRRQQITDRGVKVPPQQWPTEEFADIEAAIEGVLRARGWM